MNINTETEKVTNIIKDYKSSSNKDLIYAMTFIQNDFNLTKERVRQIKEKALRKLRNESSSLFDYI